MSELRPKPALRVDTRNTLSSPFSHTHPHHTHHASISTSVFIASTASATAAFVAGSASSPTAAPDHSTDSHSPADITCSIFWDGEIVDETATMRLRRGRMTITRIQPQSPTQPHARTITLPPHSPPLELSSVQELDVLIKSFQTRRPHSRGCAAHAVRFRGFSTSRLLCQHRTEWTSWQGEAAIDCTARQWRPVGGCHQLGRRHSTASCHHVINSLSVHFVVFVVRWCRRQCGECECVHSVHQTTTAAARYRARHGTHLSRQWRP